MKIDISPILSGKVSVLPFSFELPADFEGAPLPPAGTSLTSPIRVTGRLRDSGSCIMLDLDAEADYKAPCDRCAKETAGVVRCSLKRIVADRAVLTDGADEDDYFVATDGMLDLDAETAEELMLSFPTQILCREDCRGVCPVCGQDLNLGDCGCGNGDGSGDDGIDPRWRGLQKLLEERKKTEE